jgi:hypothetical protein
VVASKMTQFNKTTAAALIFAAIIATTIMSLLVITSNITPPAAASTTNSNTTTTSSQSSAIDLSPQPLYQERSPEPSITPINQTHATLAFSGDGVLTLPNTTQTINTTSNGTGLISFSTQSGYARETIRTENGSETATATFYEIVQFNPEASGGGGGKGIVTAVFQTNSTGILAPLNGMIAAGIDEVMSTGESHVTLWRWESGIGSSNNNNSNNSTAIAVPPPGQGQSSMNTTTTTNANASGTNTTGGTGEEQRQRTILKIPAPLLE